MPNHPYTLITTVRGLRSLLRALPSDGAAAALDFETTALHPRYGDVRLASIANDRGTWVVDFRAKKMSPFADLRHLFALPQFTWWVYNARFEARWFIDDAPLTGPVTIPRLRDAANLRAAVLGGGRYKLKQVLDWDLGITADKTQQKSDWSAPTLTPEQLQYSADDAADTWRLVTYWQQEASPGQDAAAQMFDDLLLPVIEMEEAGITLDQKTHEKLVAKWQRLLDKRAAEIRSLVPESDVANMNSGQQWSDYFCRLLPAKLTDQWPKVPKGGHLSTATDALRAVEAALIGARSPLAEVKHLLQLLRERNKLQKYVSSFGQSLITLAQLSSDGRIRASFNIAAARTGRFSSSGPNLQQVPRDQTDFFGIDHMSIRKSFTAAWVRLNTPSQARVRLRLIALDYSGIELRVLALLSGDKQLLEDTVFGDVHSTVASDMAGRPIDKNDPADKALRTAAKAVSFGIVYGIGAPGLALSLGKPIPVAQDYITRWMHRYPDAFGYRYEMIDHAKRTGFLPMVDGGTVYVSRKPELPKCANYPVQRAALTIMARAMIRHRDSLVQLRAHHLREPARHRVQMLATIHDALIDEAPVHLAKRVLDLMRQDMIAGYLDVFPDAPTDNLVEGGVGITWAAAG